MYCISIFVCAHLEFKYSFICTYIGRWRITRKREREERE